ncbi:hypothetical protein DICPUDRAFT_96862 [Dictyostelium purpureum]|uniref:Probable quinone oxidoreductase n=1 Tax=Dictyostelium purpureum TaxID=5786 RepID=F0ZBU5_DICPU|nr:uncharacterized protein DICPUDRAFT_96862 [Dictyostelium purpureum]EGC38601.1 hypothetical protein DICPUDRAFT_96862 [Dictyostelium purpureum]|eukprot:XP_003284880.1 hypothetical protein DICPUDRAFT_96862 [Dictyostelium purpureum]
MMKAVRILATGGSDKLVYESIAKPLITKETDVLIKNHFSGVNFIDTYHRSGLYKVQLPFIIGREGSGVVEQVGEKAGSKFKVGDRVCYFSADSYAEYTIVPEAAVVKLPDTVDFKTGAAVPLQGMTAHYLVRSTFKLDDSHTCLIQAGAGGLGQILIQMAKIIGAKVITTVSTEEKEKICKDLGADVVINYAQGTNLQELSKLVKQANGGVGVDVVYDGVGQSTWNQSLLSLKPLGMLCLVGNASGPVPPIDPLLLSTNGSLFLTRPTLAHYIAKPGSIEYRMNEIFEWASSGKLKISDPTIIKLENAKEAHDLLESRGSKAACTSHTNL